MKTHKTSMKAGLVAFPLSLLSVAISSSTMAQTETDQAPAVANAQAPLEEVVILGRLQSAAQDLVVERLEADTVVDLLGAEQISRVGDSNVAAALRRVPGLTLVDDKFIYVRGLGERYSSASLNGAAVPSPDLTRNVIPLDIFPASIVESLEVQKGFTANESAAFGGGAVNIRTIGIPEEFIFSLGASIGTNSESDDYLTYNGGDDDDFGRDDGTRGLSSEISSALNTFALDLDSREFDISPEAIFNTAQRNGAPITREAAAAQNAALATTLNRDIDIRQKDSSIQDVGYGIALGNIFDLGSDFQFGALASFNYDNSVRSSERIQRTINAPDQEFAIENRSVENVSLTGTLNLGVRWGDEHEISSKNLFLRNTDDDAVIEDEFNDTSGFSSGRGFRNFETRFEERELEVYQFFGSHRLGYETRDLLGLGDSFLNDLELTWFYSDSQATTEIPNETDVQANFSRDVETNEVSNVSIVRAERALNIRYTELEDEVESGGFEVKLPLEIGDWSFEFSGGARSDQKARVFEQLDLGLGTRLGIADSAFTGSISETFSDANLTNPNFGFELSFQNGLSRSYIAATTVDAGFGQVDIDWNDTWTVVIGARYEDYRQVSSPFLPFGRFGSNLLLDTGNLSESEAPEGVFQDDDVYPSVAVTYSTQDFWAEDFKLRFNVSETTVRPDIREITDASYRDPLTDILIRGNPDVVPSDITNVDLRAEWFFGNGNNFTVSLFYKDITNPIEFFQSLGAEASITAEIENAADGESTGIEFEWLTNLGFLGDIASQFFVNGNITIAESELNTGDDLLLNVTNRSRELTGASEYVVNLIVGFDSDDGKHAATLAYNTFGERIFTAGIAGVEDALEQPFDSLDFTYSYFINDNFSVKAKIKNLLDDEVTITQETFDGQDVDIFEQTVGQTVSFDVKYTF